MAENSSYIGLSMGLDVSDLKAGLTAANEQIGLANAEFKSASAGMDDWRKSTEGITAKVKQLDSVLGSQKAKLAGLKREHEEVVKAQGENSDAAKSLQKQIYNQEAVVKKTQKEFDNYSQVLKDAKDGTIDLEKVTINAKGDIKELGDTAEDAGEKMEGGFGATAVKGIVGGLAAIGGALVGVIGSFFGLAESTREYREDIGKLQTAFETAGHTTEQATDTYKELFSVFGEEDRAVEAAQQIAKLAKTEEDMAKMTNIATGVWGTFGDSLPAEALMETINSSAKIGEVQGNLADALEWSGTNLDDFNDKLATMKTEEERSAYIIDHLNGLYGEAADNYRELNKDIIDAQKAQSEMTDALAELGRIAEPIMTILKTLAAEALREMTPFVQLIGEGLKGAFEGTAGSTEKLTEGIGGLMELFLGKVTEFLPMALDMITSMIPEVISSIVGIIPKLITSLGEQLPVVLEALLSGWNQILSSVGEMLPELIPVAIDAILTLVDTFIDNIDMLVESGMKLLLGLADGLVSALPELISKAPMLISALLKAITDNLPLILSTGIEITLELLKGILEGGFDLVAEIPGLIVDICDAILDCRDDLIDAGGDLIAGLIQGMVDFDFWGSIKKVGNGIVTAFEDIFDMNSPSKVMAGLGEFLGEGVGVGMLDSMPTIKKDLNEFSDFITDNVGGIKSGLSGSSVRGGGTVINAGMTVNYNGTLSRKQLKQLENDQYTKVATKLKSRGAIVRV